MQISPSAPISRFSGRYALVTGASSGIGRATVLGLAREGATVAFSYRSRRDAAEDLAREVADFGGKTRPFPMNLADPAALTLQFGEAMEWLGRLDILVNNAGEWMKKSPLVEVDLEQWNRLLMVNLSSVFLLCREAARIMLAQKAGCIVNVTSVVARTAGGGGTVPYCAAKAGVNTLTRGLARELAPQGIRVNGIAPGLVDTPLLEKNFDAGSKSVLSASIPLGRMARPEELADGIMFLASDAASFITGEILEVNGGSLMD